MSEKETFLRENSAIGVTFYAFVSDWIPAEPEFGRLAQIFLKKMLRLFAAHSDQLWGWAVPGGFGASSGFFERQLGVPPSLFFSESWSEASVRSRSKTTASDEVGLKTHFRMAPTKLR